MHSQLQARLRSLCSSRYLDETRGKRTSTGLDAPDPLTTTLKALVESAPYCLDGAVSCLLDMSNEFAAKETRAVLPASGDGIIEDAVDDSIEYKLLESLRCILDASTPLSDDPASTKLPLTVWRRALTDSTDRLRITRPIAVRLIASRCIGVLTRVLLREACDMFLTRLRIATRSPDGSREFVPAQLTVRYFSFGVDTATRGSVLLYLRELVKSSNDIERGVLHSCRLSVCQQSGSRLCATARRARTVRVLKSKLQWEFWSVFTISFLFLCF